MLERRAIGRVAVRGEHELDREAQQRTQPLANGVAGYVRTTAELDGSQKIRSLASRPA
jgi:hypothetical protein